MELDLRKKILILGTGQLGTCFKRIKDKDNNLYTYLGHDVADITNKEKLYELLTDIMPDVIVNCCAYTNVKGAEEEPYNAFKVNCEGVINLVNWCKEHDKILIHISTDYVFDGTKRKPYVETDTTNPVNIYGLSKRCGEIAAAGYKKACVIRTSWLISDLGGNFVTNMIDTYVKSKIRSENYYYSIVNNEIGCPTYCDDLVNFICFLIDEDTETILNKEIIHFSGNGLTSWFDIGKTVQGLCDFYSGGNDFFHIEPLDTEIDGTYDGVTRPLYSVLHHDYYFRSRHWLNAVKESTINYIRKNLGNEGKLGYETVFINLMLKGEG